MRLVYYKALRKSLGPPGVVSVHVEVSSDPHNTGAPMYNDEGAFN